MRVVADSHALVWYAAGSPLLSGPALRVLGRAEADDGIVVSVATLIDLWYVTQTTRGVSRAELDQLRSLISTQKGISLHPVDEAVAERFTSIDRTTLRDPWDRLIVATAWVLDLSLVTRDRAINATGLVETIW